MMGVVVETDVPMPADKPRRGRKRKWPFDQLDCGHCVRVDDPALWKRAINAADQYKASMKKAGVQWSFVVAEVDGELRIWRKS